MSSRFRKVTRAFAKRPRQQDSTNSEAGEQQSTIQPVPSALPGPGPSTVSRLGVTLPAHVPPDPQLPGSTTGAASVLAAGSGEKWHMVEQHNNCTVSEIVRDLSLIKGMEADIRFPHCILNEEFVRSISSFDEEMFTKTTAPRFPRSNYGLWASSLTDTAIEPDAVDPFHLNRWCYTLHKSWTSHSIANRQSGNETEIRHGTDILFELAFQYQSGWKHHFKQERELFLPASPHTAKADILITMDLPESWVAHLWSLGNSHVFAAEQAVGSLVTFASEAKCKDNVAAQQQLTLDLCSAQHQRQALGFDDGQVFGSTVVGNNLTLYCSYWARSANENGPGTVVVYPVRIFSLDTFPAFIACYILLCKLANHVTNEVECIFDAWETEEGKSRFKERNQNTQAGDPWRPAARQSRSRTSDSSHQAGSGSSAQNATEPLEMEEWREDWEDSGMVPDECQLIHGDQLVRENLRAFDAHLRAGSDLPAFPAKDVAGWTRTLAESYP